MFSHAPWSSLLPTNISTYFISNLQSRRSLRRFIHTTNGWCAKSTSSGPGEFGLLLRKEAQDPYGRVIAQRSAGEVARFDLQRLVQREVVAAPHGVLDHRDGKRRRLREFGRPRGNSCVELLGRDRLVHPPHRLRLLRRQPGGLDDVSERPRLADQAGQSLRPAGAGDDPERGFGLPDLRAAVLDHDPEVAAEGELASAAELVERASKLRHEVLGDRVVSFAVHDNARDRAVAPNVGELTHGYAVKRGMPPATSITAPVI